MASGIAPWTVPPDYIGAMRAGAGIGLERARIDAGSTEAADRLKLAYSQLAAQEDRAAELAAQRQQHAAEALKHQSDMFQFQKQKDAEMQQYRQQEEERKNTALQELVGYRSTRLGQIDTGLDAKKSPKIHFGPNGQVLQESDGTVTEIRPRDKGAPKFTGPHVTLPADENGVVLSGPADQPAIVSKLKSFSDKKAAQALQDAQPNWFQRHLFGAKPLASLSAGEALKAPQGGTGRVKVVGPNGQKGTIQEGDDLPDGWKLAE